MIIFSLVKGGKEHRVFEMRILGEPLLHFKKEKALQFPTKPFLFFVTVIFLSDTII